MFANPDNTLTIKSAQLVKSITKSLESSNPNLHSLKSQINQLEDLGDQAKDCIAKSQAQIKIIDELLGTTNVELLSKADSQGYQYLQDKKTFYVGELTECRFLIFRQKELLPEFKTKLQGLTQSKTLLRDQTIFEALAHIRPPMADIREVVSAINLQVLLAFFMSILLGLTATLTVKALTKKYKPLSVFRNLAFRGFFFYCLILPGLFFYFLTDEKILNQPSYLFYRMLYIGFIITTFIWLLWPIFKIDWHEHKILRRLIHLSRWPTAFILMALLVVEWAGYYELFLSIAEALIWTILLLSGLLLSQWIIRTGIALFDDLQYPSARKARYYLGIRFNRDIHEYSLIKFSLFTILLYTGASLLMIIWGMPIVYIDGLADFFLSGFTLSNVTLVPARIIFALLIFSILSLAGRALSAYISHQFTVAAEKDTQVAMASIVSYICFAVSTLVSFLVAGINFTGLAIIAGALSVGIGFGLQHIANNFICGVILLIQKPVKPGDRVVIGNAEGFVRRIRILSTQISTMQREDIIIPNSDLVTQPITNYMFRDKLWRVSCFVGVKYGSDTELVKNLLLEVAAQHPEVIQETPNAPSALFKAFGESTLDFELRCIIKDVNRKRFVISDLNSAIDKSFKDNNITIAFPQRDLHIVSDDRSRN